MADSWYDRLSGALRGPSAEEIKSYLVSRGMDEAQAAAIAERQAPRLEGKMERGQAIYGTAASMMAPGAALAAGRSMLPAAGRILSPITSRLPSALDARIALNNAERYLPSFMQRQFTGPINASGRAMPVRNPTTGRMEPPPFGYSTAQKAGAAGTAGAVAGLAALDNSGRQPVYEPMGTTPMGDYTGMTEGGGGLPGGPRGAQAAEGRSYRGSPFEETNVSYRPTPPRRPAAPRPVARPRDIGTNVPASRAMWDAYNTSMQDEGGGRGELFAAADKAAMEEARLNRLYKEPVETRAEGGAVDRAMRLAKQKAAPCHTGIIHMAVGGRTDHIPMNVLSNSYVLPADIVSGLGEGNTLAGSKILDQMFKMGPFGVSVSQTRANPRFPQPPSRTGQYQPPKYEARGGDVGETEESHSPVEIIAAGGEYVVPPKVVAELGGGDMDRGHEYLDNFVKFVRHETAKTLKNLPGPRKD
jgi:hypothetical protein